MVSVGALVVVDDLRPARWLAEGVRGFAHDLGSLLPATFAAYARIFHAAHDDGATVSWAQIARANSKVVHPQMQFTRLIGFASRQSAGYRDTQPGVFNEAPAVGTLPAKTAVSIARVVAGHTTTADHCWFAAWDGWGDLDRTFQSQPKFQLPQRSYHLARGPLTAAAQSISQFPGLRTSPSLWWPDDRAWCIATDIDLDSTYIGASDGCIEELIANPDLEALPLSHAAGITADSDALNPVPLNG